MNRRERHIRILDNFGGLRSPSGSRAVQWELDSLFARHGLALLTDEAIEMLVRRLLASRQRQQRMNAENRRINAERKRLSDIIFACAGM